jgi:hypothetical protein
VRSKPAIHARDHRPGGADPLEVSLGPFLILQGIELPVSNPGGPDWDDHGKFDPDKVFTNDPSAWDLTTVDGSGRIMEIVVKRRCLLDVTLEYVWEASGTVCTLSTLINIFGSSETFNGVLMFGVSPVDRVDTAQEYMGTLRAIFPNTNTTTGKIITAQPDHDLPASSIIFGPTLMTILQLPLP